MEKHNFKSTYTSIYTYAYISHILLHPHAAAHCFEHVYFYLKIYVVFLQYNDDTSVYPGAQTQLKHKFSAPLCRGSCLFQFHQ